MIPKVFFGLGAVVLFGSFYFPVASLLFRFGMVSPWELWHDAAFRWVFVFTYWQALLSALFSAAIGTALAIWFSESGSRFSRLARSLSLVPFSLPPILVVLGLLGIWGKNGPLGKVLLLSGLPWSGLYGWVGILAAHAFLNFPLFVRLVGQALREGDRLEECAALALGCSRLRCFIEITWPKIRNAFWGAFLLAFLFCSNSFLIVLILGGNPYFTTVGLAIYQAIKFEFDLPAAASLAAIQSTVALGLMVCVFRLGRIPKVKQRSLRPLYNARSASIRLLCKYATWLFLSVFVVFPLVWILAHGLKGGDGLFAGLLTSLGLATAVGLLSTGLAFVLEYGARGFQSMQLSKLTAFLCTVPLAFSSLLVMLSWRLVYPVSFNHSFGLWTAVVLAQSVLALPLVFRPVQDAFERIPEDWRKTARTLGASPARVFFWVELPTLRNSLLLAFVFGAFVSLGEAGSVLLFLNESTMNLTYLVYESMGHYRFEDAYAAAAALLGLTALLSMAVAFLERDA